MLHHDEQCRQPTQAVKMNKAVFQIWELDVGI
jgi:hypothetical protein